MHERAGLLSLFVLAAAERAALFARRRSADVQHVLYAIDPCTRGAQCPLLRVLALRPTHARASRLARASLHRFVPSLRVACLAASNSGAARMTIDELRRLCADLGIVVSIGGTVRQADIARLLGGVSVRTVQRMRRDGLLPAPVRIGRSKRYSLADLADAVSRFVARRAPDPLPAATHREHSRARPIAPCSTARRR